jgi:hypothetical protein
MNNPFERASVDESSLAILISEIWQEFWGYLKDYDPRPEAKYQHTHSCRNGLTGFMTIIHFKQVMILIPSIPRVPPTTTSIEFSFFTRELQAWAASIFECECARASFQLNGCEAVETNELTVCFKQRGQCDL